jgi:hypothetical protein
LKWSLGSFILACGATFNALVCYFPQEEQLKRRAYEKTAEKGTQPFKVPMLVNTRVTQAYPIVKPVERCRPMYWKDMVKVLTILLLSFHKTQFM